MTREDDLQMIAVQNVNMPGHTRRVNRRKYEAMHSALLTVLPANPPGLTQQEMVDAVRSKLPETIFPGGSKITWWTKAVQLDLEAKGIVVRDHGHPTRWRRAPLGFEAGEQPLLAPSCS